MKKLNPFQKVILNNVLLPIFIIILHSLIYGTLAWYTPISPYFEGGAQSQPLWFVCLISNFMGIFIDIMLFLIIMILYEPVIEPIFESYKKTYKKKNIKYKKADWIPKKKLSDVEQYKQKLLE